MVIDFHTHTFPDKICVAVKEKLSDAGHIKYYSDFSAKGMSDSMRCSGIDISVNLPVMTSVGQVEKINADMIRRKEEFEQLGIITLGGMHPDYCEPDKIRTQLQNLKNEGIKGIKMHPAYQGVDADDPRYLRIYDIASDLGMIVVIHAGVDIGIPDHNFASVKMILNIINEVKPEKFVLAHMGGWWSWNDVKSDLAGAPVYFDSAFSLGEIEAKPGHESLQPYKKNMDIDDFVTLARAHGTDKVLFGSDLPWADAGKYVQMIRNSGMSESEVSDILGDNAARLMNL